MSVMDRPAQPRGGTLSSEHLQQTAKDIVQQICSLTVDNNSGGTISPLEFHIWNELKSKAPTNTVANYIVDMVRSGQPLRQFIPRDVLHQFDNSGGSGGNNSGGYQQRGY